MEKAKCFLTLVGCMMLFSYSFAQTQEETARNEVHKYDHAFSGVGPKVYILPPPKSEKQILEENYVLKWQTLSQIEDIIEQIRMGKRLHRLTMPGKPPTIRTIDWDQFNEEQKLKTALKFHEGRQDVAVLSDLQNNLGNYYLLEGELKMADSLYNESLDYKNRMGLGAEAEMVLENLAVLKIEQRDYETALRYFQKILETPVLHGDRNRQADLFLEIAKIEAKQGNFDAAQDIGISKTVTIYKATDNYNGIVTALNALASFMIERQKYVEAKWYYLQAIDVAKTHSNVRGLAFSLYNLGVLKNTIQDYTLAIDDFKQAGEIADSLSMKILLLQVKNGLGDSYLQSGDYTAATVLLDEYNVIKTDFLNNRTIIN